MRGLPQQGLRLAIGSNRAWPGRIGAMLCLALLLPLTPGVQAQTATAPRNALTDLRQQAQQGDPAAMARLGRALATGEGITQNAEAGLDWLRRAAERGNVQGMYWYASMLYNGEGGPANATLAVSWLKRAAESGHLASMLTLSQAYAMGQGTAMDKPLAYAWVTIVTRAEPLKRPDNASLIDFKLRAEGLREAIGRELSAAQREEATREAEQWNAGQSPRVANGSAAGRAGPSSSTLPPAPTGSGLPSAPKPVPGADNPLNRQPGAVDPRRPLPEGRSSEVLGSPPGSGVAAAAPSATAASGLRRIGSGSAFFVTIQGAMITNHHVVRDCRMLRIIDGPQVQLMAFDAQEDLAVLVGPPLGRAVLFRASDRVNQGEEVLAYGFPLQSVLATSGQIGAGLVSATSGLRNNPSQLQVDVPLQTGNSGGPLLDRQGDLVGMTVAKLNALQVARVTGDVPQNVNFAIKHSVIKRFLDQHKLQYRNAPQRPRRDAQAIAEEARSYTVALECLG